MIKSSLGILLFEVNPKLLTEEFLFSKIAFTRCVYVCLRFLSKREFLGIE